MYVPSGVSACLYNGIMDKITFIKTQIEWNENNEVVYHKDFLKRYYYDIEESIEFYIKHCVVSSKFLYEAFEDLKPIYNEYMGK